MRNSHYRCGARCHKGRHQLLRMWANALERLLVLSRRVLAERPVEDETDWPVLRDDARAVSWACVQVKADLTGCTQACCWSDAEVAGGEEGENRAAVA